MSAIRLLLAPSISIRSRALPSLTDMHESQILSGSPSVGSKQFKALANTLAVLVFPVPRGPQNK